MTLIDLQAVLAPISDAEPSGPDLGYDPSFAVLERAAQGKPQQQIGTTVVPGEDPDWKAVQKQATALLAKTRDLRVAIYLVRAMVRTGGWAGLQEGLALIQGLVEKYWDGGLHPRLDPEDDNDPTIRVNVLRELGSPDIVAVVRGLPLCVSPVLGPLGLKQVESASGDGPAPQAGEAGQAPVSMAAIEGTLAESPLDSLRATDASLRGAVEALAGIEAATGAKVGVERAPSFERLSALLGKAAAIVREALALRTPGEAAGEGASGAAAVNGSGKKSAAAFGTGEISSREDVLKALDKICAYYAKYEPSSPIPMFMERSKRLVMMTFADIVKELVPDAAAQVAVLRGSRE
jgi:type VI secretion system protein ImpA